MFKVGQKVCTKQWINMPSIVEESYGEHTIPLGAIGTVKQFLGKELDINSYDVIFDKTISLYPLFVFEQELEPLIKVGEQLLLWE